MSDRPRVAKTRLLRLRAHRAFSLVELLVVVALLAALAGLLLPALQSAREAARRAECQSNLRQMGLALHHYQAAFGRFPPGCVDRLGKRLGWSVFALPYLEQSSVWALIDVGSPFNSRANSGATSTVLPIYLCPSTVSLAYDRQGLTTGDRNGNGLYDPGDQMAWIDYGGMFGAAMPGSGEPANGVMIWDRAISLAQIRDGASETLLLGEDTGRGAAMDGQWANGENIFDQAGPINASQNNELWSDHPRGAHGLFCDGGARFLNQSMDLAALKAICTRAAGDLPSAKR